MSTKKELEKLVSEYKDKLEYEKRRYADLYTTTEYLQDKQVASLVSMKYKDITDGLKKLPKITMGGARAEVRTDGSLTFTHDGKWLTIKATHVPAFCEWCADLIYRGPSKPARDWDKLRVRVLLYVLGTLRCVATLSMLMILLAMSYRILIG